MNSLLVLAQNIFSFCAQHRRYHRLMVKKYSTHSPSSSQQRRHHQRKCLVPPTHTPGSETLFDVRGWGSRQDQSRFFGVHSYRRPQLGLDAVVGCDCGAMLFAAAASFAFGSVRFVICSFVGSAIIASTEEQIASEQA